MQYFNVFGILHQKTLLLVILLTSSTIWLLGATVTYQFDIQAIQKPRKEQYVHILW